MLRSFEDDIELILNEDTVPLLYPQLDVDYDSEDLPNNQYGIFPNEFLGLEERMDKEANIQSFLNSNVDRVERTADCKAFLYTENGRARSLQNYLSADINPKYRASMRLLGLTLSEPDTVSAQGDWIFLAFFADGLPSVEQFLESILSCYKVFESGHQ